MMRFVVLFALCLVLSACVPGVRAQDPACYSSGSIAGIVIATIVVTLVMAGLAAAFIWYLWKQRKIGYGDTKSLEKPIVCPPMSPDKQMIARESNDYAFDNPYFKDDETDHGNPDAAEKGESGFRKDNGDIATPVQNAKTSYDKLVAKSPLKTSNGTAANNHHKKSRPFSSLPFHAVFHPSGKKQQRATMDDTYISKHLERITVPLRGHDFTGLGFNICGNMRDGIFVKDVLHRGPASESGKIKAGDRIVGVTVSFAAMVYEDALTILSYASPYDVRLEIEKAPPTGPHLPSSSPKRIGASTSFRNNGQRRLFHPLYRSQSIDDLTQIGKDGFGVMDSSGSQRDSSSSATPKRSQSVEASNVGTKSRPPFILKPDETKSTSSSKGSRTPSTSSCESTAKATTPTDKAQPVLDEEVPCTKKEAKSARFRAEQANVTSEASLRTAPPAKPARELPEDKTFNGKDSSPKSSEAAVISPADPPAYEAQKPQAASNEATNVPDGESDTEKPTAPPRKANSTPKRKAPAPPPAIKTETSAVVHRADDLQPPELPVPATETAPREETSEPPPPPPTSELPPAADEAFPAENKSYTATHELHLTSNKLPSVFSSAEKITTDPGTGSSDTSSLASSADNSTKMEKDDQNSSPGKRKASSLGDLTKLEQGASKKTSISSAILERAVSLDLQQSIPGENLTKQKKILRAPAFEDDYLEDREDLSELNGQGLKRWDDGLDIVFAKLPNGETNSNADSSNSNEDEGKISTFDIDIDMKDESKTENKTEKIEEKPVQESSTEKSITELVDDSPVSEIPPPALQTSASIVTSTPVKRVIEVRNLNLDDSSEEDEHHDAMDDDVPYLASAADETKSDESTTKYAASSTTNNNNSTALFSPVTISIPVIKPDLTHFEKLPSPPPASTHPGLDSSWRMSKTITTTIEDGGKPSLERISVQSLYKPIFASKEIGSLDEPDPHAEKLVNGNDSDASEHYSTAHENTSTSSVETSSLSVTLSSNKDVTKTPNTIAGFAKTLIIPGPNEVENLLSLAEEPITPPPALEPPAKPTEHE